MLDMRSKSVKAVDEKSSFLNGSSSNRLILPRSRQAYRNESDGEEIPRKSPDILLSGDEVRNSIRRESHERAAEKSRLWSGLARDRQEELLARIQSEAQDSALSRIQAENLANAQYRLQRQQREQAREKSRQDAETQERNLRTPSAAPTIPLQNSSISSPEIIQTEKVIEKSDRERAVISSREESNQDAVTSYVEELCLSMQSLSALITSLPSTEASTATERSREIQLRYKQICQRADTLASVLVSEDVPNSDMTGKLTECVKETKILLFMAESELKKLQEEERKRRKEEKLALECEKEEEGNSKLVSKSGNGMENVILSASQRAQETYEIYCQKAKLAKSAFCQLETDPALKSLKSAVLFASSNPVTICTANSPTEIIEPYRKAFLLLRGAEVETLSIRIRLSDHPDIVHYVRYNMAKKFIDLACMQFEEKNEIKLFALATLFTELWACDLQFGQTFLALLFTEYPVLIPYYAKLSLKVEGNLDLQLKRLGALSKFYAAIMQTDRTFLLRRLFPTKTFEGRNPHGVEAGWELLAGLVNQDVQPATTVLVLRNILSVSGWLLKKTYEKQFAKLMMHISRHVLPKIREKTPKDLQGPVERLAELLDVFHRTQTVPVPENRLSEEFWMS